MKVLVITAAAFMALSVSLSAQTQATGCDAFAAAIDGAEKDLAMERVMDPFSASVATAVYQRTSNDLQLISVNLSLAAANHCPPRREPVTADAYYKAASACNRAAGQSTAGSVPECDRSTWKRDPEKK